MSFRKGGDRTLNGACNFSGLILHKKCHLSCNIRNIPLDIYA